MAGQTRNRRRPYRTGDEALDAGIEEFLASSEITDDADLLRELITSCFRLARVRSDRGEMKLVNAALKEFVYAFKVFREYRGVHKVSIFGSSRSEPGDPNFEYARQFGAEMAQRDWMVITGAGPGIMEAGHEGAGAQKSFGANIRLPLESTPNVVIEGDPKLINFKYFFTRKVTFLKESDAFALFPGGFGTLDETFELLTLMQTGKSDLHPIVLVEVPGGGYWDDWERFIEWCVAARGLISEDDTCLYLRTHSIDEAVAEIDRFYRNYQSQRYVNGTLVLRVLRVPPERALVALARDFSDVLSTIEEVGPSSQEMAEGDALEYRRLALDFNHRSLGRLRKLIDALNEF